MGEQLPGMKHSCSCLYTSFWIIPALDTIGIITNAPWTSQNTADFKGAHFQQPHSAVTWTSY